jgi:segregation and condensation protein B
MERRLVRIVGRAEEPGRPMLYGTTREFLQIFGLGGLDDLPQASELRQPSPRKAVAPAPEQATESEETPPQADAAPVEETAAGAAGETEDR